MEIQHPWKPVETQKFSFSCSNLPKIFLDPWTDGIKFPSQKLSALWNKQINENKKAYIHANLAIGTKVLKKRSKSDAKEALLETIRESWY